MSFEQYQKDNCLIFWFLIGLRHGFRFYGIIIVVVEFNPQLSDAINAQLGSFSLEFLFHLSKRFLKGNGSVLFKRTQLFFFQMGQPSPFFVYFRSFKQISIQFLQQVYAKKCPSSIRCQDSNPQPLEYESLPITTRTGLLPNVHNC